MQNNRMLQARYRYLQARRDFEYAQLKEAEKQKLSLDVPKVVEMKNTGSLACPSCGKGFKQSNGLASHLRHKTCEAKGI